MEFSPEFIKLANDFLEMGDRDALGLLFLDIKRFSAMTVRRVDRSLPHHVVDEIVGKLLPRLLASPPSNVGMRPSHLVLCAWVKTTSLRLLVDHYRHERREVLVDEPPPNEQGGQEAADEWDDHGGRAFVERAVKRRAKAYLPLVKYLFENPDATAAEAAEAMNISVAYYHVQLGRIRNAVQNELLEFERPGRP